MLQTISLIRIRFNISIIRILFSISIIRIRFSISIISFNLENNYLIYMKTLKDFIKESQEINESLFGDIVRKLLDTGLSWISGSVKWIANKSADAVSDIWKTHRDVLTNTYSEIRRSNPKYKFLPETPKTAAECAAGLTTSFLDDEEPADVKIKRANALIANIKNKKGNSMLIKGNIADFAAQCYACIISSPKYTNSDKTKAKNFLQNIKSSVDTDTADLIDSNIKHIISGI